MSEQFFWPIFGVTFVLAILVLALVANHLRASRKLKLRAIQKEERLKAMEAGTPLPEVDEPGTELSMVTTSQAALARQTQWLRIVALSLGFLMIFGGLGMYLSFTMVQDRGLQSIAAIGILPALAGVGLLLFYWVTRGYGRGLDAD